MSVAEISLFGQEPKVRFNQEADAFEISSGTVRIFLSAPEAPRLRDELSRLIVEQARKHAQKVQA